MTTLSKQQSRALTEIVVEQLDTVINHIDSILAVLGKTRVDMEILIERMDPAEIEQAQLLIQDLEQTLTVDIEQSKLNAEQIIKRLLEGAQTSVVLQNTTWGDLERIISLSKKYSKKGK